MSQLLSALLLLAAPLAAQVPVYELGGASAGDNFGRQLVRSGDLDGDGIDDLLIGAPRSNFNGQNSGSVLAVSGANGAGLYRVDGAAGSELFGQALDTIGDLNGDGVHDWIAGAPFASSGSARNGRVEVHSGVDGSLIYGMLGIEPFANLGTAVAGLGDIDGDLVPDFMASAPFEDSNGTDAGTLYLYSGATGSVLRQHFGAQSQSALGLAIGNCGDADGDGTDDYAAGTPSANAGLGVIEIWSGQSGSLVGAIDGTPQTGTIGSQFASVADMDGDGRRELAIGALQDQSTGSVTGAAYVYSIQSGTLIHVRQGQSGESLGFGVGDAGDWNGDGTGDWLVALHTSNAQGAVLVLSGMDGSTLAQLLGAAHNGALGSSLAGGFDLNGDGLAEFAAGDPLADGLGTDSGSVLMVSALNLLGRPFCFGDGSGIACPCGNFGASGTGCSNSSGLGARLEASGSARVSADDLLLAVSGSAPAKPALLFVGTQEQNGGLGTLLGDGLLCAGGSIERLSVRFTNGAGEAVWGPGLNASKNWSAGQTRAFQVWYRDGSNSPCGNPFNLSNGLSLDFLP